MTMSNKCRAYELVKTFELGAISSATAEDAAFIFRIEVFLEVESKKFHGKIYRKEIYRLQPTFPQRGGQISADLADCEILVADHFLGLIAIEGETAEDVMKKATKMIEETLMGKFEGS